MGRCAGREPMMNRRVILNHLENFREPSGFRREGNGNVIWDSLWGAGPGQRGGRGLFLFPHSL